MFEKNLRESLGDLAWEIEWEISLLTPKGGESFSYLSHTNQTNLPRLSYIGRIDQSHVDSFPWEETSVGFPSDSKVA